MLLRAIDFETAEFAKDGDDQPPPRICEFGITDLLLTEDGASIGAIFSSLCDPGCPITPEASSVHHIVDADVRNALPFSQHAARVLDDRPAYLVAHGADFERRLFDAGETPWIDTWKIALRIWPDEPSHKLQVLRYAFNLQHTDLGLAHRAGPDSVLCALLMKHIIEQRKFSLDDMVRFSNGPALLPRIPLGMHIGKKWDDVPASYLDWMVNKSNGDGFGRDVLANAKYWLKRRTGQSQ